MSCPILDPDGYLSACLVDRAESIIEGLLLVFALWRIQKFVSRQRRAKPTRGQGWTLASLALLLPLLRQFKFDASDVLYIFALYSILWLKYEQTGRRVLPLPEVLWYFSTQALFSLIRAASTRNLRAGIQFAADAGLVACEYWYMPDLPLGYENATIFGKITVSYMSNVLKVGIERQLDRSDFAASPRSVGPYRSWLEMQQELRKHDPHGSYRVMISLLSMLKWRILTITALELLTDVIIYCRPSILALFLTSFKGPDAKITTSVYYALMLGLFQVSSTSTSSLESLMSNMAFVTSRSALTGSVYRKSLTLSLRSREEYDGARIMNLLNVDTQMVQLLYAQIPTLVAAPVGLVLCTWQLFRFLGWSTVAAIPIYLMFIPYSSWYTKRMFRRFPELMAAKDKRTKATWSVFQAIKSLKLYTWESPYAATVKSARREEIGVQAKYLRLQSVMSCISYMLSNFVATAIFIAYLYLTGNALTPELVFPTLSLLSFLSGPFFAFPRAVSSIGRAITSQKRINDFLSQPDHTDANYYRSSRDSSANPEAVTVDFSKASTYWNEEVSDEKLALRDITLQARAGDLTCVVGRVGSGKTALLKSLCGQLNIDRGSISVKGDIAYCAQEPWLQFNTIKENILFGLRYDKAFYEKTLEACQLLSDLDLFPSRDDTDIGEKGITLSGGQKARVALARAVYSRADIYVLDDILAAVDEHVAKRLTDSLLSSHGLLAGKTIVLATNSRKVLRHASQIVVLEDKTIREIGGQNSFAMSIALGIDREVLSDETSEPPTPASEAEDGRLGTPMEKGSRRDTLNVPPAPSKPAVDTDAPLKAVFQQQQKAEEIDTQVNVVTVLRRYVASVGWNKYFWAFFWMIFAVVMMNLIVIWLTIWSDKELRGISASKYYVVVYLALSLISGFSFYMGIYGFLGSIGNTASIELSDNMLNSVIRSPMVFFETTPLGSIINRFTGDISILDGSLPSMIYYFSSSMLNAVISFVIMISGAPFVLVVLVPLLFLYNSYRKHYIPASRQMQRISSSARSPILSHIEESVKGVNTVRAFDSFQRFIETYEARSSYWMHAVFMRVSLNQWLSWRINAMTATMTLSSALCTVILVYYGGLPVGVAGVVLYSTQNGGNMLSRIIRSIADLEVSAVAVERIMEYTDLPPEAPLELPEDPPLMDWPQSGQIELVDYSTRYRDGLPNVLHNVSLAVRNKEKIGVVGRTGAGKSTVSLAIFRLIEPTTGHIKIDGLNTSELGLYTLRNRLSIIPQDAQIFKGSLRHNLDPLHTSDDARLWQILELCHLKDHFSSLTTGLDTELADAGDNLSRGQAQLICLGRSLLHEAKVLILDEATASVDQETDQIVQQTIRSQFTDRTIVTVAHRLDTIMDSDRIVVLEKGRVKEFDTPANLLEAKGLFWELTQVQEQQ